MPQYIANFSPYDPHMWWNVLFYIYSSMKHVFHSKKKKKKNSGAATLVFTPLLIEAKAETIARTSPFPTYLSSKRFA